MASGYIVVRLDENAQPTDYWDGTAFQSEIDLSDFIPTKPEARYVQGSTQAQDTSVDIAVREAESNITLVP